MSNLCWRRWLGQCVLPFALVLCTVSSISCNKSVEPPLTTKNPRDYTWTMDTLAVPGQLQTSLESIWGSSSNDVYAVGSNSGFLETIYHFDGTKWTRIFPLGSVDPNRGRNFELESITGFAPDNVWVSGAEVYYNNASPPPYVDSSVIFHYDGSSWTRQKLPGREFRVYNLWGDRPDNIWATGLRAIWHYDGMSWSRDSVPESVLSRANTIWITSIVQAPDGSLYCIIGGHNNSPAYLLRKTAHWALLDSASQAGWSWGFGGLWISPEGSMYSFGMGVYNLRGVDTWSRIFDTAYGLSAIRGHDNDIIAVGEFGRFFYYDGTTATFNDKFYSYSTVHTSVWTAKDAAFICGFMLGEGYQVSGVVVRGK